MEEEEKQEGESFDFLLFFLGAALVDTLPLINLHGLSRYTSM